MFSHRVSTRIPTLSLSLHRRMLRRLLQWCWSSWWTVTAHSCVHKKHWRLVLVKTWNNVTRLSLIIHNIMYIYIYHITLYNYICFWRITGGFLHSLLQISLCLLGSSWFILVHLHSLWFLILFLIIVLVVFVRVLVACLKSGEAIAQSFPAKAPVA